MFDALKKKLAKASLVVTSDEIIAAIKLEITRVVAGDTSAVTAEDMKRLKAIITRGKLSTNKKEIFKQIRFLLLAISNRKDEITLNTQVSNKLQVIMQEIGTVPVLNKDVRLPVNTYWAKAKTVTEWGETPWYNPSRTNQQEKIGFFTSSSKKAGVREQLFSDEIAIESTFEENDQFMSYSDATRLPDRELEADHFQASSIILEKQKEMVEAMNIDPIFCKEMLENSKDNYYFVKIKKGKGKSATYDIVGTKNFYMEYHNCVDNIWLMRRADNLGKSASECIDYMQESDVYVNFLTAIGGEDCISKGTILWTVNNDEFQYHGMLLAQAMRQWFRDAYPLTIESSRRLTKFVHEPTVAKTRKLDELEPSRKKSRLTKDAMFGQAIIEETASSMVADTTNIEDSDSSGPDVTDSKAMARRITRYKGVLREQKLLDPDKLRNLRKIEVDTVSSDSSKHNDSLGDDDEEPQLEEKKRKFRG